MNHPTLARPVARGYRTVNPSTGELLQKFDELNAEQAEAALARAHEAYIGWQQFPIAERVRLFRSFIDLFEANVDEIVTGLRKIPQWCSSKFPTREVGLL